MTTTQPVSLRAQARSLPLEERKRRQDRAESATGHQLLTAVVEAGLAGNEWRSAAHCASEEFAVSDRTFRRWLADPEIELPSAVWGKLLGLAWAFAVEVKGDGEGSLR